MPKQNFAWVRYALAGYLQGRGVSWGAGPDPIVPSKALDTGKYSITLDWQRYQGLAVCDADFKVIGDGSLDHVFVSPRLHSVTEPLDLLARLVPKLKQGGHLLIHSQVPLAQLRKWLTGLAGWQEKDTYEVGPETVGVWKLQAPKQRYCHPPKPQAAKRACIARYGAIGDMIMVTPLIRALAQDGYEVTVNLTPYAAPVLQGNPYVHNLIVQERDIVPNEELGEYWDFWRSRYTKYISLSETIEGQLLKVEGRKDFYTPCASRANTTNYYTHTLTAGGYPQADPKAELYFTSAERKAARFVREKFAGKFLVMWGLRGSSHHKQYPALRPTLTSWLASHPDTVVLLSGGPQDKEAGWESPQVFNVAGEMPLREAFAVAQVADLVVGPESSLVNAAGCFDAPQKLILLSHSGCENLCSQFVNHECLTPSSPCHPCHQLHYSLESCPLVQIQGLAKTPSVPRCTTEISPQAIHAALDRAYAKWVAAK